MTLVTFVTVLVSCTSTPTTETVVAADSTAVDSIVEKTVVLDSLAKDSTAVDTVVVK